MDLTALWGKMFALGTHFWFYCTHFEITGGPCNLIGSNWCDLFTNRTIFASCFACGKFCNFCFQNSYSPPSRPTGSCNFVGLPLVLIYSKLNSKSCNYLYKLHSTQFKYYYKSIIIKFGSNARRHWCKACSIRVQIWGWAVTPCICQIVISPIFSETSLGFFPLVKSEISEQARRQLSTASRVSPYGAPYVSCFSLRSSARLVFLSTHLLCSSRFLCA